MQDDWNLGHTGRTGYSDAIAELVDYRKVNRASESVLRGLPSANLLEKGAQNRFQNDAVAVYQ